MWKKVILGTLLVGLIAVLMAGAIIRTIDKTDNVAEARGLSRGRSASEVGEYTTVSQGQRGGGYGQGGGYGRSVDNTERLYPNYETAPEEWSVYEGTVVQAPAAGDDLVLKTVEGQEVTIGTGPGYMEAQGFTLEVGEQVQVQGYWEDGEFKASQLTRLGDGLTIAMRDQAGRPAWAGGGQWATTVQAETAANSAGQGGFGGEGRTDAPGDGTGTGQAQVDEWLTLGGTVVSVDSNALVVETDSGEQVVMENRPWWFAQEQAFSAQPGDSVTVIGFYEDGEFEVGQIDNLSTGQTVTIRDESGRPLWAGRGRRGGS
jgi:hypothetical protein